MVYALCLLAEGHNLFFITGQNFANVIIVGSVVLQPLLSDHIGRKHADKTEGVSINLTEQF